MFGSKSLSLVVAAALLTIANSAQAVTVPFTENFSTGDSDWKNSSNAAPVFTPTGGIDGVGDGFISFTRNLSTAANGQTVVRSQDNFSSSGNNFFGDWVAAGVKQFSFYARHNASIPLTIGTRFAASGNAPAWSIQQPNVPANTWTLITFSIDPSNPAFQAEGIPPNFPSFNDVFTNLGAFQLAAASSNGVAQTGVTFDFDKVSISTVPEPTSAALGILGVVGLGFARRFRRGTKTTLPALA